jgi:hypothetical protein
VQPHHHTTFNQSSRQTLTNRKFGQGKIWYEQQQSFKIAAHVHHAHQSISIEIPTDKQPIKHHSNMIHIDF